MKPPVEITCNGPFHFDFVRYIASVDRDVVLRQINLQWSQRSGHLQSVRCPLRGETAFGWAGGTGDCLIRASATARPGPLETGDDRRRRTSGCNYFAAREAEARGDRVQIHLRDRRLAINSSREALLVYGPNAIRALAIEYQQPADDEPTTVGRFKANGPGALHYVPDLAKPRQVLQATWQRLVELGRDKGQPTLVLEGRPQLAVTEMGALSADRITVSLRELQGNAAAGMGLPISGGGTGQAKPRVVPDRLAATGRVEFQSAQLIGRTQELHTTFRAQPAPATAAPTASTPAAPAAHGLAPQQSRTPPLNQTKQPFHIDADRIQIGVLMRGNSAVPSSVVCERNVVLREVPTTRTAEQPLEIRGGRLTIDQLEHGTAHITLTGAGPTGGGTAGTNSTLDAASKLAQLTGRGVTVLADSVELDQRDNRLWSNGPGKATLLVTRDMNGAASTTPIPITISWAGGLQFDGRTVTFRRNIVVAGTNDTLHCNELSARLATPLKFGQSIDQRSTELAEVECRGNVSIDHRSRDDVGITSHERLQIARLAINQQTGEISGDGPGVLRSTRFGNSLTSFAAPQLGSSSPPMVAPPPGFTGSKLNFLRLDFQEGIIGNMRLRDLSFHGRVRAVYGPVDSWEQELDTHRPETLPAESVRLSCEELRVHEDPIAARAAAQVSETGSRPLGKVQLEALHNVRLDGRSAERGAFGAQAQRASYDQSKETFILEGDMRTPATLWYAGQQGAPPAARKITFVRSTGDLKIEGLLFIEFTSQELESASRPNAPARSRAIQSWGREPLLRLG